MNTGILALQGSFHEHSESLKLIGRRFTLIKSVEDLDSIDSLILPGGESTAMLKIQENNQLFNSIKNKIESGLPTLGTCAGLILLSSQGVQGKNTLNILDCEIERNGYGRQNQSFEGMVEMFDFNEMYCFIRAPRIVSTGDNIEVIAKLDNEIVGVKSDNVVGLTFHPELTNDNFYLEWLKNFLMKGSDVRTF